MDARRADLLDLHENVTRRVRNLETGVHPLRADIEYANSILPTLFPKAAGGSAAVNPGGSSPDQRPYYQKRSGVGSLMGWVILNGPHADAQDDDGALYGILPAAMRPTRSHSMLCYANEAPWVARISVRESGEVRFWGLTLPASTDVSIEGFSWPTV